MPDARLSALSLSAGDLTPEFDAGTLAYTVSVEAEVWSLSLTAVVAAPTYTPRPPLLLAKAVR